MFFWPPIRVAVSALFLLGASARAQTVDQEACLPPLIHAHAHNDYEHTHPLFDALRVRA